MRNDNKQQLFDAFTMVGSVGISMAASVAVTLYIGRWVDNTLGTAPWGTVLGVFLGFIAGLWGTYKRILKR